MSIIIPSAEDYRKSIKSDWLFSDNVLPNAHFLNIDIKYGGSVVSSPIEQGSFFSYNKTTEPIEITATLGFDGSNTYLQTVLNNLNTLKTSVTTFSIISPFFEFQSMTLESYDYSLRSRDGLGVLYIKAHFIEIKEIVINYGDNSTITQAQSKNVSAVSTVQGGLKQAKTPTKEETKTGNPIMDVIKENKNDAELLLQIGNFLG